MASVICPEVPTDTHLKENVGAGIWGYVVVVDIKNIYGLWQKYCLLIMNKVKQ